MAPFLASRQTLLCPGRARTSPNSVWMDSDCLGVESNVRLADKSVITDLIKYDTPYLGPRIQLMLSQIQFKLNVEEQYMKGIEKMVQLYQMEGDKKSKGDAASKRVESKQKIILLKQALRRYEELHIDMDSSDSPDGMTSKSCCDCC